MNIKTWLDEDKLVWGSNLSPSFQEAINVKSDYVILFISESSARSKWVQKEINWALEKEKKSGRNIILPICIQSGEEDCASLFPQFADRKKLILSSFDEIGIEKFAKELSNHIFSFVCSELDEVFNPTKSNTLRTINSADAIIGKHSKNLREIVFYHREDNPITVDQLYEKMVNKSELNLSRDQFDFILEQISQRGMIPGLYFDGYELYLEEEHMAWKTEMAHDAKLAIARRAAALVKSNMSIYIDAGSTAAELVKIICNRIVANNLHNLSIATISISHANTIAQCCVAKGFDDTNSSVKLELIGGYLRQNTEATVPITDDESLMDNHTKFDLAFIGANGASERGFTILPNAEEKRKKEALSLAKRPIILCDATKCGITLKAVLASKTDDFEVIMDEADDNAEFLKVKEIFNDRMMLVKN